MLASLTLLSRWTSERNSMMTINYLNFIKLMIWLCIIGLIIYMVFHHLFPFALSLIIAVMINPIVQLLQDKLNLHRKLAVLSVLVLILFSFITIITFSLIELVHLFQYLTQIMPHSIEETFKAIQLWSERIIDRSYDLMSSFMNSIQPQSQALLKELMNDMVNSVKDYSQHVLVSFFQNTINTLTNLLKGSYFVLFILIGTFFISSDGPKWLTELNEKLPGKMTNYIHTIKESFVSLIKKYALAQLIIVFITGVIVYFGLLIFDVKHALAIASVAIFLDLIPFIGISALFTPWILYLFFTNHYTLTVQLSILFILLILIRNIIEPKLIGSSIGIHPLFLIMILFVFMKLFGFFGILIGPMVAVSIKALSQAGAFTSLKNYLFDG
ncbi:sporulation integral membrane protein YtvI [Piscibacillus salipiscarius]|uniref:Sporulation integral membrane protein YtvI n=3 Tax=Piscibacillus salipiscarius TaxID=299480 RepID=A0ABW5QDC4_9BACI